LFGKQTYPQNRIEIIVVDNNSTDKTKEIARRYTKKVYNKGPERSAQRNYGMLEKARGKYVMYLDADFTLEETLIEEAVERMESEKNLVGLYIPLRWVGNNWIIKARGFEREFYDGTVLDAVRFIRRRFFKEIGGFDESLYAGEDWDLNRRLSKLGKTAVLTSRIFHNEDDNISIKDSVKKNNYYSKNLKLYMRKWGEGDPIIRMQLNPFFRIKFFFEKRKWRKVVAHPLLFLQVIFLKVIAYLSFNFSKKEL